VGAIEPGDRVLSWDPVGGRMVTGTVTKVHKPYTAAYYFVLNGRLRVTEGHPVYRSGGWVEAGVLGIGDMLLDGSGKHLEVASVERIEETVQVYNFQVDVGTYVADGVVVHNKEDCEDYTQYFHPCEL